jgi:hypothetical protein
MHIASHVGTELGWSRALGPDRFVLVRRAAGRSVGLNGDLFSYPYTVYSLPYSLGAGASGETVYRIAILIQCIDYRIGYVAGG